MNSNSPRSLVLNPVLMFVGILLFSSLNAGLAAPAYKPVLKQAMTLYTAGIYGQAYDAFRSCLLSEPQNPRYYYYMGNCLLKLGYVEPALSCFRRSVKIGTDTECNIHALRALETWVPYLESQAKNANTLSAGAVPSSPPAKAKSTNFFGEEPDAKVSEQVNERRGRVVKQKQVALLLAKYDYEGQLNRLDRKLAEDKRDVPQYIYLANGKRTSNPDYDSIIESLKQECARKKADALTDYQRKQDELNVHWDGLIANEDALLTNFKSQLRGAQLSTNKLTPVNSGVYVRNYINLSGSEEESAPPPPLVELTAKAKSLTVPAAKSGKDKK